MLLCELILPVVPVYHQTTLKAAISILRDRMMRMSPEGTGNDAGGPRMNTPYFSTARSMRSAYIETGTGGSVVLVLNRNRLQSNNKVEPYRDPYADGEIGDEMEDRVYGRRNGFRFMAPVNNTVVKIIVQGGRSYNVKGEAAYTEQDFQQLENLANQYGIPIEMQDPPF